MVKEFVDFLGGQPPYDALGGEDLERLVAHLEVEYFAAGSIVVAEGAERLDHMWVVRTGELEVVDRGHVVDVLGPGDTFGHVSVLSNLPPVVSVRAAEDSLCLRLPDPRTLLSQPERLRFTHLGTMVSQERLTRPGIMGRAGRPVSAVMQPIVWCVAADRVRDVARSVGAATHSCALIRAGDEIGIVTDRDFRQRVATGEVDLDAPDSACLGERPRLRLDRLRRQHADEERRRQEHDQRDRQRDEGDERSNPAARLGDRQRQVGQLENISFAQDRYSRKCNRGFTDTRGDELKRKRDLIEDDRG